MYNEIDKYTKIDSPIHNWDTRCKIISIFAAIFSFSFIKSVSGAAAGFLFAILILFLSRLPLRFIIRKISYPLLFLLPLFILLPFTSGGEVIATIKNFDIYYDGLRLSLMILIKTSSIIILFLIIMGTSPFNKIASALKSIGLPVKLLDMILFTYRYIFVFIEDIRRMKSALLLRGFRNRNSIGSLKSSANLAGSLLIRSYEHTDRIYNSMILRGYSGDIPMLHEFSLRGADICKSLIIAVFLILIFFINLI